MSFSYLSICSGVEAASVALEPLGWRAAGYAEIEKFPSEVLAERYGANMPGEALARNGVPNHGDFTAIDLASVPPVDVLFGGTPCQAFSVAGKRLSLADARGNLSLAYGVLAHELARSHGLRFACWENVPGVLSTDDNAFGCFLSGLVGADDALLPCVCPDNGKRGNAFWRWSGDAGRLVPRWPDFGLAAGPGARVAWRVLDAQWFGVAQRRARVFVVAGFGEGADPAAVLFECKGLRGHSPPCRKTREDVAGTLSARTQGGGWLGTDFELDGGLVCAAHGQGGAEVLEEQCPTLTCNHEAPIVAHALRAEGFDASEDGTGRGTPLVPVAYRTTGNDGVYETGDHVSALTTGTDPNSHLIAFSCKDHGADAGEISPTLRSMGFDGSHANGGGQVAVAYGFQPRIARNGRGDMGDIVGALTAQAGDTGCGDAAPHVAVGDGSAWAVRRLLPVECERLQGFPDNWTRIARGGKGAEACPDGPRYKAMGNSMAVPVMRWIGARMDAVLRGMHD